MGRPAIRQLPSLWLELMTLRIRWRFMNSPITLSSCRQVLQPGDWIRWLIWVKYTYFGWDGVMWLHCGNELGEYFAPLLTLGKISISWTMEALPGHISTGNENTERLSTSVAWHNLEGHTTKNRVSFQRLILNRYFSQLWTENKTVF